jgi:hypothetical protein
VVEGGAVNRCRPFRRVGDYSRGSPRFGVACHYVSFWPVWFALVAFHDGPALQLRHLREFWAHRTMIAWSNMQVFDRKEPLRYDEQKDAALAAYWDAKLFGMVSMKSRSIRQECLEHGYLPDWRIA